MCRPSAGGTRARERTRADRRQLRPRRRSGDGFTRRERADLHLYPRGLAPVVAALETDAVPQRAHRIVLAGLVEPVAAQAAETLAARDDAKCHAFARRRASFEAGHRHKGRTLAAFEGFADRKSTRL